MLFSEIWRTDGQFEYVDSNLFIYFLVITRIYVEVWCQSITAGGLNVRMDLISTYFFFPNNGLLTHLHKSANWPCESAEYTSCSEHSETAFSHKLTLSPPCYLWAYMLVYPQIKLFPVFFVSIRSCPECKRLWPPTDCQGLGLVYRPLWNCMGDDALNRTALSTPVLWYIQVQFTASCLRCASPCLWWHFLNCFPREEKIADPLLNLLPCSLVIFTWSYEKLCAIMRYLLSSFSLHPLHKSSFLSFLFTSSRPDSRLCSK